jgi:ParB family transcriptional regulator, chromosome partitioning protein
MLSKRSTPSGTSKQGASPPGRAAPARGRRKRAAPARGLTAIEVIGGQPPADVEALCLAVRESGGGVIGAYRDPVGGHWQVLASLPIDRIGPTPFQRDISAAHVARLADVIDRMGRYLDPIVAVRGTGEAFWTPNGHHRLAAMRSLGARSIIAVVVPELSVAYQILAMNTEKGHNLREKSLEAVRMARSLAELEPRAEREYALEFEEPSYLTLGLAYEQRGRLSGGAYHPVLKRAEAFSAEPLAEAIQTRTQRAERLLALDDLVIEAAAGLKKRGFTSPYLKAFVVARINPLRFRRGAAMSADAAIEAMSSAARKFDPDKVKPTDLAGAPPGPAED